MKYLPYIIAIILLGFSYVWLTEARDKDRIQQSEIDHLKKQNKQQADSLTKQLTLTRDSLQIAFNSIRLAAIEREQAHARTQQIIRNYEKIIYIQHTDSSRSKALSQLYKTYVP